jgi:hypothetical protein
MDQTTNTNFLSPFGYKFVLSRAPNLNYTIQSIDIPGIQLSVAEVNNPFTRIPTSGKIMFGELSVEFKVNESLDNYLEIFNWMIGLGYPSDFRQYDKLKNNQDLDKGISSDIKVLLLDSSKTSTVSVEFTDAFPIQLSPMRFDATLPNMQYVTATATFRYLKHEITKI